LFIRTIRLRMLSLCRRVVLRELCSDGEKLRCERRVNTPEGQGVVSACYAKGVAREGTDKACQW
jgi:hypothetical protein